MEIRVLVIGDVVGKPGREALRRELAGLREREGADLVIANAENAAGGSGLTPDIARRIFNAGVDVVTLGDHCFKRAEVIPLLEQRAEVLRPANLPPGAPGKGWCVVATASGVRVGVVNALGRIFMKPADCPFRAVDAALEEMDEEVQVRIVDFHAEATSEKVAMAFHLDGRVTAVIGTHTHVATCDERILEGGTATITDIGMTGPHDSVIGRRKDRVLTHLLTGLPARFDVAKGDVQIHGVAIRADSESGKASEIRRVRIDVEEVEAKGEDAEPEENG